MLHYFYTQGSAQIMTKPVLLEQEYYSLQQVISSCHFIQAL